MVGWWVGGCVGVCVCGWLNGVCVCVPRWVGVCVLVGCSPD